jgi:hypothetical protein
MLSDILEALRRERAAAQLRQRDEALRARAQQEPGPRPGIQDVMSTSLLEDPMAYRRRVRAAMAAAQEAAARLEGGTPPHSAPTSAPATPRRSAGGEEAWGTAGGGGAPKGVVGAGAGADAPLSQPPTGGRGASTRKVGFAVPVEGGQGGGDAPSVAPGPSSSPLQVVVASPPGAMVEGGVAVGEEAGGDPGAAPEQGPRSRRGRRRGRRVIAPGGDEDEGFASSEASGRQRGRGGGPGGHGRGRATAGAPGAGEDVTARSPEAHAPRPNRYSAAALPSDTDTGYSTAASGHTHSAYLRLRRTFEGRALEPGDPGSRLMDLARGNVRGAQGKYRRWNVEAYEGYAGAAEAGGEGYVAWRRVATFKLAARRRVFAPRRWW